MGRGGRRAQRDDPRSVPRPTPWMPIEHERTGAVVLRRRLRCRTAAAAGRATVATGSQRARRRRRPEAPLPSRERGWGEGGVAPCATIRDQRPAPLRGCRSNTSGLASLSCAGVFETGPQLPQVEQPSPQDPQAHEGYGGLKPLSPRGRGVGERGTSRPARRSEISAPPHSVDADRTRADWRHRPVPVFSIPNRSCHRSSNRRHRIRRSPTPGATTRRCAASRPDARARRARPHTPPARASTCAA